MHPLEWILIRNTQGSFGDMQGSTVRNYRSLLQKSDKLYVSFAKEPDASACVDTSGSFGDIQGSLVDT